LHLSDNITHLKSVGSKALRTVNLPAKLEKISGYTFKECGELNKLIIPNEIKNLKWLYEETRDNWKEMGEYEDSMGWWFMFNGCSKLPIKTRQRLKELGYKGEF